MYFLKCRLNVCCDRILHVVVLFMYFSFVIAGNAGRMWTFIAIVFAHGRAESMGNPLNPSVLYQIIFRCVVIMMI